METIKKISVIYKKNLVEGSLMYAIACLWVTIHLYYERGFFFISQTKVHHEP